MASCARCCLHQSIRIVNMITNFFAIGMIVYSLWLQQKWNDGVAELPSVVYLPRPWFIYACLAVGIAVCLSTLFGQTVANCISNSTLCIYIGTICSLVLIQAAVVVVIFFRMDWAAQIAKYIDAHHTKFKVFVVFHIKMCQLIAILILVPQVNVIALATILWIIGTGPGPETSGSGVPSVIQSFLVGPNSSMPDLRQSCNNCQNLLERNPNESFWSYIKDVFRMRFRRNTVS